MFLVPYEILLHYPDIDISHSLSNDRTHFFLPLPKLVCLMVLSSNYCFYYFDATKFQYFLIFDYFRVLVPFEMISLYPNIDSSQWFRENVQLSLRRKDYGLNGFNTFFSLFSIELIFACICFHSHKTCYFFLLMIYE